jgi:hypothetical protein
MSSAPPGLASTLTASALALVAAVLLGACGSNGGGCTDGFTKTCLEDGTTCTCAPSCTQGVGACSQYELCGENGACVPCSPELSGGVETTACICVSAGLCVPTAWAPGESLTFEPVGDEGDGGGSTVPTTVDGSLSAPNE